MSKQMRFYILPADINLLIEKLQAEVGLKIFNEMSETDVVMEIASPLMSNSMFFNNSTSTFVRCYIAPAFGVIKPNHYLNPERWVVQPSSEAIQFSGCDYDGKKTLLIGRMYFQTDELIEATLQAKREEFLQWAEEVFHVSKKMLHYDRQLMAYVGEHAAAFRKNGGKFASSLGRDGIPVYE